MSNLSESSTAQSPVLSPELRSGFRGRSWLALAAAAVLLLFANGANNIPLAAWLAPLFLLRFVRLQRAWLGLCVAYIVLAAAFAFQFRGMVPVPDAIYYVVMVGYALLMVLPYIADRILTPRLHGALATLVFPATFVVTEYLASLGPYGTWGSVAYSQYGNLALHSFFPSLDSGGSRSW